MDICMYVYIYVYVHMCAPRNNLPLLQHTENGILRKTCEKDISNPFSFITNSIFC